jgi:lysophospholipase L1-like esterase
MKQAGLPFFDMTMVFAQVEEDLYTDDCCHFNARGNHIIAQALAMILLKEVERQSAIPQS